MGIFRTIADSIGKGYNWLFQDDYRLREAKRRGYVAPEAEDVDDNDSVGKQYTDNYDAWEEIDNFRTNFYIGSWARNKMKRIGENKLSKEREEVERKHAADEGREYKSRLQLELEAATKKREGKEQLKAEKRRQKEARN